MVVLAGNAEWELKASPTLGSTIPAEKRNKPEQTHVLVDLPLTSEDLVGSIRCCSHIPGSHIVCPYTEPSQPTWPS